MNDSLIELQTQLTFQDESLQKLTHTVVRQQQEIDMLKQQLTALQRQIRSLQPSPLTGGVAEEEVPPHY